MHVDIEIDVIFTRECQCVIWNTFQASSLLVVKWKWSPRNKADSKISLSAIKHELSCF